MDKFESTIRKAGESVKLTAPEREKLSFVVREYMEFKPVRGSGVDAKSDRRWAARGFMLYVQAIIRKPLPAALALALFFSGTVSYAAEGSVPGDALYPVKVHVNEEVRSALSVSTEARAAWEARLAERRLEEAARLAAQGRLDVQTREDLRSRFEAHADKATDDIGRVKEDDSDTALKLASDFENHLSAHGDVLSALLGEHDPADVEEDDARELTRSVRAKASLVGAVRAKADARFSALRSEDEGAQATSSAALERGKAVGERGMNNAEDAHRRAVELYARASAKLSAEESARIKTELSSIEDLLSAGKGMVALGNYADAARTFREAGALSQKLQISLKAVIELDVRASLLRFDDSGSHSAPHDESEQKHEPEPEDGPNGERDDDPTSVDADDVIRSSANESLKLGL